MYISSCVDCICKWLYCGSIYAITAIYHTSNSHECMGINGEALQLHTVYKKLYFLLQVTPEFVSGTPSHARIRIRYCKLCALRLNVQ